jgi:putative transcriptional regulator
MSKFGKALIGSAREALAIAQGEGKPARAFSPASPASPDVAAIRKRLGLSQDRFAQKFGLSPATVRDWEQGRRQPHAPARNFLRVIDYAPETVERAIVRAETEAR